MTKNKFYKILTTEGATEATIMLYDYIGEYYEWSPETGYTKEGITDLDFVQELNRLDEKHSVIHLRINSPGGDMFHGNAIMALWAPALAVGATVCLTPTFSASGFLSDVRYFGATFFTYVGKALAYLMATPERPDDADNTLIRGFGTEASPDDQAVFRRRFGAELFEGYGSSEGGNAAVAAPDAPPGALGRPAHDGIAVVDPDSLHPCAAAILDAHGRVTNAEEAVGEVGAGPVGGVGGDGAVVGGEVDAGGEVGALGGEPVDAALLVAGRQEVVDHHDVVEGAAAPEAAVHTLQIRMPAAITRVRLKRSARLPRNTAMKPKLSTHTAPARKPYCALLIARSWVICGEKPSSMLRSIWAITWITSSAISIACGLCFQRIVVSCRCGCDCSRRSHFELDNPGHGLSIWRQPPTAR